jgi:hypothetical protein
LDEFWAGRATWQLDLVDVGLPVGESDTIAGPDGQLWAYLHASFRSAGIVDSWGSPVPFPGCVTLWTSADAGQSFGLSAPTCLIPCRRRPCAALTDHVGDQQYPRVARHGSGALVMVYEWRGHNWLRTAADGLHWSPVTEVAHTGQWNTWYAPCASFERIGAHPFVAARDDYDCSVGGPPGVFIEDDTVYVFVGLGKNPGSMGCYAGSLAGMLAQHPAPDRIQQTAGLHRCWTEPLFTGASFYGPLDAHGPAANPYFDFRTVSAADVVKVGERYYMAYEGVRGPDEPGGGDTQFGLGFARSGDPWIDGPWEKYAGTPVLLDLPGNVGIGHADLLILDGVTYLYTATSDTTRGRYVLAWDS